MRVWRSNLALCSGIVRLNHVLSDINPNAFRYSLGQHLQTQTLANSDFHRTCLIPR